MRHRLLWRIAIPYAVLLIVVMGGLGLYLVNFQRTAYLQQISDRLMAEGRLAGQALAPLVAADPHDPRINELVQHSASAVDGRVTVILPDGSVVGESDLPIGQMENHLGRPEVQEALHGKQAAVIRYSSTLKIDLFYAASPLNVNGVVIGAVRVAYPLDKIQTEMNRLAASLALAMGLVVLLAILLATWIASATLRPLRLLNSYIDQIGAGTLPEIQDSRGKDEVSQLQSVFVHLYGVMRARFQELRTERSRLEAVLANMTDGIVIADAEGTVQLINPAARSIFNVVDDGQNHSLVETVRYHQIVELWRSCLSTPAQPAAIELFAGRYNLQVVATRLGEGSGVGIEGGVLMVFQDLTRIRRLETVRRDFISNVSHELRTPLASLKALTETLQEGALEDPPAARRFLSQMETEIDNLTQMVRELLELSRIESGRVPLKLRPSDPCALIAGSSERMRLQAERAGLVLSLECAQRLPEILADPVRIDQVMVNLIHNAVKFTPPGGSIQVGAYTREREGGLPPDVVFFVRDSGVGIQPEDLARIFERFYKADRSRSGGGTGLGLSIARHLVESHGGQIWAESQPNRGSTFFFSLPRSAPARTE